MKRLSLSILILFFINFINFANAQPAPIDVLVTFSWDGNPTCQEDKPFSDPLTFDLESQYPSSFFCQNWLQTFEQEARGIKFYECSKYGNPECSNNPQFDNCVCGADTINYPPPGPGQQIPVTNACTLVSFGVAIDGRYLYLDSDFSEQWKGAKGFIDPNDQFIDTLYDGNDYWGDPDGNTDTTPDPIDVCSAPSGDDDQGLISKVIAGNIARYVIAVESCDNCNGRLGTAEIFVEYDGDIDKNNNGREDFCELCEDLGYGCAQYYYKHNDPYNRFLPGTCSFNPLSQCDAEEVGSEVSGLCLQQGTVCCEEPTFPPNFIAPDIVSVECRLPPVEGCTPGQQRSQDCGTTTGQCEPGKQYSYCTDQRVWGAWGQCIGAIGPIGEVCDGIDNDCDGATDEGCVSGQCTPGEKVTRSCGVSDVGICSFGTQESTCKTDGTWGAWSDCVGDKGAELETCGNNIDEDCNGYDAVCPVNPPTQCIETTEQIAYWKFNEDSWSGNINEVKDSRDGYHGKAVGKTASNPNTPNTVADAKFGRAGSFDGADTVDEVDFVRVDENLNFNEALRIRDDMTISLWAKYDNLDNINYGNVLVNLGVGDTFGFLGIEESSYNYLYYLSIDPDPDKKLRSFWEYGSGRDVDVFSDAIADSLTAGTWHFYTFTRNSATREVKFYIDGEQLGTTRTYDNNPAGGESTLFYVGADVSAPDKYNFDGIIDDVSIWNRVLSDSEIAQLYNSGNGNEICTQCAIPDGDQCASDNDDTTLDIWENCVCAHKKLPPNIKCNAFTSTQCEYTNSAKIPITTDQPISADEPIPSTGFYGRYYNHADNGVGDDFEEPTTYLPIEGDSPFNHPNWYDESKFKFDRFDDDVNFSSYGTCWFPVNYAPSSTGNPDPHYFASYWKACVKAIQAGTYQFSLASDDDSWVLLNGNIVGDLGGVHPACIIERSVQLDENYKKLEIYFAERHKSGSVFMFNFTTPGVTVVPWDPFNNRCAGTRCGDGIVDSVAGEQCDDGVNNGINGRCSAICQNEQITTQIDAFWSDDGTNRIEIARIWDDVKLVAQTNLGEGVDIIFNIKEKDNGVIGESGEDESINEEITARTDSGGRAVFDWGISEEDMKKARVISGGILSPAESFESEVAEFYFTARKVGDVSKDSNILYVPAFADIIDDCGDYTQESFCNDDPENVVEDYEVCQGLNSEGMCAESCKCEWRLKAENEYECVLFKDRPGEQCQSTYECVYYKLGECQEGSDTFVYEEIGQLRNLETGELYPDSENDGCPNISEIRQCSTIQRLLLPFFSIWNAIIVIIVIAVVYYLLRNKTNKRKR